MQRVIHCRAGVIGLLVALTAFTTSAVAEGQSSKTTKATAKEKPAAKPSPRVRWKAAENNRWRWYERENLIHDKWELTGITSPVHKFTGEVYTEATGYLDESDVPIDVRRRQNDAAAADEKTEPGRPHESRKAREGRPPSEWLRGLEASELREWLKTIDVPEAGVEGMTFWEHLTRDHGFSPEKIEGLTEEEQAKLHAAAHAGY